MCTCMHAVGMCSLRFDFFLEMIESQRHRHTRSWWGSEKERERFHKALLEYTKETCFWIFLVEQKVGLRVGHYLSFYSLIVRHNML